MSFNRRIRFLDRVTASVQELRESLPPDPVHSLGPKARGVCEDYIRTASPERKYHDLMNDCYPLPRSSGSGVEIKPGDDPETLLTKMQDAYRTEIQTGARLLEMRQVFQKLQGVIE